MKHSIHILIICLLTQAYQSQAVENIYLSPIDYIKKQTAQSSLAKSQTLALSKDQYKIARKIASKASFNTQIRYWKKDGKTIWILQALGKTKLITAGYTVKSAKINDLRVLIYRESHGYQVAKSKFEQQFKDIGITEKNRLDKSTTSIAGATLSVDSVRQMAALALYLDSLIK